MALVLLDTGQDAGEGVFEYEGEVVGGFLGVVGFFVCKFINQEAGDGFGVEMGQKFLELYPAEELAGKSGKLELLFSVSKNESCAGSFYEDYALQASFTLDTERCKNIVSSGATVANVGSDKQLTYTILPGKGIDTVIYADVTDFEMDAAAINGVRMKLDFEVDDAELMDKVDEIISAIGSIDDGAAEVRDGTGKLYQATGTLNTKVGELNDAVNALYGGTKELADGTTEFADKTADMDTQISDEIDSLTSSITGGDGETESFVSDKNTSVSAVQFVIKTAAVEKAEAVVSDAAEEAPLTFWEKLLRLFGLD
mgnify:CR=1 FL=1